MRATELQTPIAAGPRKVAALAALLLAGAAWGAEAQEAARAPGPAAAGSPALTEVARFGHQVTGVTAARDGRVFVNFPRWSEMPRSPWPR